MGFAGKINVNTYDGSRDSGSWLLTIGLQLTPFNRASVESKSVELKIIIRLLQPMGGNEIFSY